VLLSAAGASAGFGVLFKGASADGAGVLNGVFGGSL